MTVLQKHDTSKHQHLARHYNAEGLSYLLEPPSSLAECRWFDKPEAFGPQSELIAYLLQLEEEGFARFEPGTVILPWEAIYQLLDSPEHVGSVLLLGLPAILPIAPNLQSWGGLTDSRFSIAVAGWRHQDGAPLGHQPNTVGAIVELDGREALLPETSWRLLQAVKTFAGLPATEKTANRNRRDWAHIRGLAIAARAGLDNFLARTVILTPEKLQLRLRKARVDSTTVVEVIPEFEGVPSGWLRALDGYDSVQERYDIPDGGGMVQVLIEPAVKTVLSEVKRMPDRRVAGRRAEAFVRNPFALLGEDAGQVISDEEFEEAREDAGIYFCRFTVQVTRDEVGICGASLLIESSQRSAVTTETYTFNSPNDLRDFIRELENKLSQGMQCCAWRGWDLELLGEAEDQLRTLRDSLAEWLRPRPLVRLSGVYDLSRYSERIKEIGQEKTYYSAYIRKASDDEGWFPDNVTLGFFWTPEGSTEPIGISIDPEQLDIIAGDIAKAKAEGKVELHLPSCPKPIRLAEAEGLLASLREAIADVKEGTFPNTLKVEPPDTKPKKPLSLVLKPNIVQVDYSEERRRVALARDPHLVPRLPKALKPEVRMLDHQLKGVAWLQNLWNNAPAFCRGALLADDMGLGKTLQLLTFIASCFEENSDLEPALVVAPVSLLENWDCEIKKFMRPGSIKVETLYGDGLAGKKLRRDEIDQELIGEGLTRFLRPGWRDGANIVLTTYETLRDLEFSLASERWSIMICDEAQKIKNANALVTRAAKKQNVRFKVACTGTPVENSLADLWCLFDFIQPGLLGALNEFGARYRRPIEAKSDEERARVDELRKVIESQLIRRVKREVAKDLPRKLIVDSCKSIQMSPHQKTLYSHAISQFKLQSPETGKKQFANHLGLLHYLKRVCADPRPIGRLADTTEPFEDYANRSPKMRWLIAEVERIRARNEKAIVFTEYRDIQRLIQGYVRDKFGTMPDIINGDTTASSKSATSRQKRLDAFQKKPGFGVIILSPLAVGFGVNIQAANHVIHYTRTWNPAKEDQATDRAYRIGQEKDVFVYSPIVTDSSFKTFEKTLDELLDWKRNLSEDMLNGSGDLAGADFGELQDVDGAPVMEDRPITIEDVLHMDSDAFEAFCAALWQRQGYPVVYRTKKSGDSGVDVVAIKGSAGVLIQAKSSLQEGRELGWEAVKDVVAGEATYKAKHPEVTFTKYSATNQFFNKDACYQAQVNNVMLVNQERVRELLTAYPVSVFELERYLTMGT